ncbi:MAG: DUF721 domain-containing protein [Candidatus Rokubacteria bacterium]|nr:DUF721 domain-containing protein [Candidatus Rokubacteria bacterium]
MGEIGTREPTPVGNLLGAAVPTLRGRLFEVRIRREWRELVGAEIARRCQPVELRNGTLELIVDNSPWLHELSLREAELLSRLGERYGREAVRALRFSLGTLPPEPAGHPGRSGRSDARLAPEDAQMIEAAVALIAHPELRAAVRRLLEKASLSAKAHAAAP